MAKKTTWRLTKTQQKLCEKWQHLPTRLAGDCFYWARKTQGLILDRDELFSAAQLGLIFAAKHFKPELGYKFSTYAYSSIRQNLERSVWNFGLIRIPANVMEDFRRIRNGKKPFSPPELLEAGEKILHAERCHTYEQFDLAAPLDNEAEQREISGMLRKAVSRLRPKRRRIIKMRFGIGQREHTLQEIADVYGLTKQCIQKHQEIALADLAKILEPVAKSL